MHFGYPHWWNPPHEVLYLFDNRCKVLYVWATKTWCCKKVSTGLKHLSSQHAKIWLFVREESLQQCVHFRLLVSNLWHVPSLNLWISMAWWSQMIQILELGTTGRLSEWSRHPRDQSKAWLGTPRWKMARLLLVDLKEHPFSQWWTYLHHTWTWLLAFGICDWLISCIYDIYIYIYICHACVDHVR